jgi:hypothetical protein
MRLRCHFQRICFFFFQRLELRFMCTLLPLDGLFNLRLVLSAKERVAVYKGLEWYK